LAKSRLSEDIGLLARDEAGVLRDTITNARVLVISAAGYRAMADSLFDHFSSGAGVILLRMGEGYARKVLGSFSSVEEPQQQLIEGFQQLAFLAGWGKVNLRISNDAEAECVVEKCAFVLRRSDIGPTSCYFFTGMLSGIGSELMKKKFKAQELKCATGGSSVCKFKIFENLDEH